MRPGGGRKALAKVAKALVAEETNSGLLDHWQSLERQGHMSRCMDQECAHVWVAVVKALPEEQMKFALNTALDVLPHNSNLQLLTLGTHAHSEGYCSCPVCLCVCVCVSVRSFLPPRASRPRNIGTYVFTATWKKFYNRDFR